MLRAVLLVVIAVGALAPTVSLAAPEGQISIAAHVTLAPRWLDPGETESAITPFIVLYAIHDAMAKPMPGGASTPGLAESWSVSKDGLTWEFVLRNGARFHNGDPVTADDVKFSFERYKGGSAKLLKEKVREVRVVDARHVRFILKEAWPDFLAFYGTTATGAGWIVPKKYVEKVGDDGFKKAPIGAGPYKFVSFNPGIEMTLEAFEGYWRKVPAVKRVVIKSVPEESTRAAALKRGEVDIAYFLNGPIAEDVRRTPGLKLTAVRTNALFYLDFVEQWDPKSPWADRRVRLAASLAIDRKGVNEAESLGFSGLTGNIVPRHMEFAIPIEPHPYDIRRAKQLMVDAGHANGFDGGELAPNPPYFGLGESVVNNLNGIGIRMRLKTMERAAWLTAYGEKKMKGVVLGAQGAGGNAATRIESMATKNGFYAYGVLPEIQDMFERQARELDRKKREAMLHEMQKIIADKVVFAPIWENGFIRGVSAKIEEPALTLVPAFPYVAPFEDLRIRK